MKSDHSPSANPSGFLLTAAALFACASGIGAVLAVVAVIASRHPSEEESAASIHLATPEEKMADPAMVSRGREVFEKQACAACHGKLLEGATGPCLTDAVWAKGSSFADIRKSINEGSSEKGMPAFDKLSEDEKIALVAFINSRAQGVREVKYALYEGKWSKLPDFSALKPEEEGALKDGESISLDKFERTSDYGAVFTGTLLVPAGGDYTFQLASDDGSQLLVDGQLVVNHDGLHGIKGRKEATVPLKAGGHAFELRYFQGGADQGLRLSWSGPVSAGFLTEAVAAPEEILVKDKVRVVRGNLAGQTGPRMLAIGLPGNANVAFDPDTFALPFAWRGDFLDVGGTRQSRGQDLNRPTGGKTVAQVAKPLVRAGDARPEFTGYRIAGRQLVVEGRLAGARFDLTLEADGHGATATLAFRDTAPAGAVAEDIAGAHPVGDAPQVLHFTF